ncbi:MULTISPECIES: sensor histidine kinase [Paenibacillus]|uniref:sensor histidine kinase n=1 Tax=Paenibacillus TaxID=44249 RepID=UPI002FE0822E
MNLVKTNLTIWILRIVVVLTIAIDMLSNKHFTLSKFIWLLFGLMLIQLNDLLRVYVLKNRRNNGLYQLSLAFSILSIALYVYLLDSFATNIYYIFPIFEMFMGAAMVRLWLLALHAAVYLGLVYSLNSSLQDTLLSYLATLLVVFLFRQNQLEKNKVKSLNEELLTANIKLLENARQLREITIVKERTDIAQELHDNLGHSLVALKMHLEFAGQVLDNRPYRSAEAINKALDISQAAISSLRKAVSVLKEDALNRGVQLQESINELIRSMKMVSNLKFDLHFDPACEEALPALKDVIYRTVQEAVTNGLKHGQAERFWISIAVDKTGSMIKVLVENNGANCTSIVKSHGLRGIEERIRLLRGTVRFSSGPRSGFTIAADLPYASGKEEGMK